VIVPRRIITFDFPIRFDSSNLHQLNNSLQPIRGDFLNSHDFSSAESPSPRRTTGFKGLLSASVLVSASTRSMTCGERYWGFIPCITKNLRYPKMMDSSPVFFSCLEPKWPLFLEGQPSKIWFFSIKAKGHLGCRCMYTAYVRESPSPKQLHEVEYRYFGHLKLLVNLRSGSPGYKWLVTFN